jgi:glucokinase
MKSFIIGIDLGGTSIRIALADLSGHPIKIVSSATEPKKGQKYITDKIACLVKELLKKETVSLNQIIKIGVGAPGPILKSKGIICYPPNLPGWKKVPLKKILEKSLNTKVILENDANAAALGEARFGAGKSYKNIVYLTVSTGIGGGVIINRRLFSGSHGTAAEPGHMIIDPHGPLCGCGQKGCLEALSSGTALEKMGKKIFKRTITSKEIESLARQGNKSAVKLIVRLAENLGIGIANLANLFDPEIFILGGGLSNMGELLFAPLLKSARKHCLPIQAGKIKIVAAKNKSNSGIIGAISLCL